MSAFGSHRICAAERPGGVRIEVSRFSHAHVNGDLMCQLFQYVLIKIPEHISAIICTHTHTLGKKETTAKRNTETKGSRRTSNPSSSNPRILSSWTLVFFGPAPFNEVDDLKLYELYSGKKVRSRMQHIQWLSHEHHPPKITRNAASR